MLEAAPAGTGVWRAVVRAAVLLAVLLAGALLLQHTGTGVLHKVQPGWRGATLLIGVGGLMTAAGLPRQALAFTGGYVFGAPAGAAIGLLGQLLGCILDYAAARFMASGLVHRMLARPAARRTHRILVAHPFTATLTLRLLPVGSNVMLNLLAGASRLNPAAFITATLLGYLPQTIVFALVGSGTQIGKSTQIWVGLGVFAVALGLGVALYRKARPRALLPDPAGAADARPPF